jgi:hypothetical protein
LITIPLQDGQTATSGDSGPAGTSFPLTIAVRIALALSTLQVAAALLTPAQLSVAGGPETFGCCFVRFHLWHKKPFFVASPNRTS